MLDIKYIREHADEITENCKKRRVNVDIAALLRLDEERRSMAASVDALRAKRKQGSKTKPSEEDIRAMRALGAEIKEKEAALEAVEKEFRDLIFRLPNLTHATVPDGPDESGNRIVRAQGEKLAFSFQPKEHWELGEALGGIDIERAARVSGARFAYLLGDIALLQFALVQYAFSILTSEKMLRRIIKEKKLSVPTRPFIPVVPPVMIRPEVMHKMGRLEPKEERYHIPSDDVYLVGSAEHTIGPLHMDETISEKDLPLRYVGYSTAFRREAGSYGKDTKGILRVHQFDKIEIESFTAPDAGEREQDFIVAIQEHLMESLGIPYQVVLKCTGDMGAPDYREFDIESWLPGQNRYRETHTSDYMTDYQSRRLNTKVTIADGTTRFVHMNDATVFAIGRTMIAIMENYQEKDGSIRIPKVLQPYMGKKKIVKRT